MCVSFCHRQKALFFSHEDCSPIVCRWAIPTADDGECDDCMHNSDGRCGVTNQELPADACCHKNIPLTTGLHPIGWEQVVMLPISQQDERPLSIILKEQDVSVVDQHGELFVNPDQLPMPDIYGIGTDPVIIDDTDESLILEATVTEEYKGYWS